jgi:hypothetical protein
MAKQKKKLSEIKDALMSGTSFMKNQEPIIEKQELSDHTVELDKSVYSKIKLLATYYKKNPSELVNDAIIHYLRLKKLDIDDALKNLVVGTEDDE